MVRMPVRKYTSAGLVVATTTSFSTCVFIQVSVLSTSANLLSQSTLLGRNCPGMKNISGVIVYMETDHTEHHDASQ